MDLTSICAAFGLSAAAGLNAWLPLFAGALLTRLDAVDLALHTIGTVVTPVSGAVLFTGQTGVEDDALDGRYRRHRQPLLSLLEDAGSALLTFAAFVLPVLALLLVVALAVAIVLAWRRARRRRLPRMSSAPSG